MIPAHTWVHIQSPWKKGLFSSRKTTRGMTLLQGRVGEASCFEYRLTCLVRSNSWLNMLSDSCITKNWTEDIQIMMTSRHGRKAWEASLNQSSRRYVNFACKFLSDRRSHTNRVLSMQSQQTFRYELFWCLLPNPGPECCKDKIELLVITKRTDILVISSAEAPSCCPSSSESFYQLMKKSFIQ
jgi:hypothetical protein